MHTHAKLESSKLTNLLNHEPFFRCSSGFGTQIRYEPHEAVEKPVSTVSVMIGFHSFTKLIKVLCSEPIGPPSNPLIF